MNKLIISNIISQLTLESETILKALDQSLKIRDPKAFRNYAFQLFLRTGGKKGWDGCAHFFNAEKGTFPTGLIPEITKALQTLNIKLEIEDQRTEKLCNIKHITPDFLDGYELYDYQYNLANKAWEYERGIIEAATASGKTLLFIAMLKAIPPKTPVLLLFDNRLLCNQTYHELVNNGIQDVGIIHGEAWNPNIVLCALKQSLDRFKTLLPKFKVLIVDECHLFSTEKCEKIFFKMTDCRYRFGFSATPWDPGDKIKKYKLKGWLGPILGSITTQELQEREILSSSICYFHEINKPDNLEIASYQDAYNFGVIHNNYFHNKIKEIIDSYKAGRIIILVERIAHGDILNQIIPNSLWVQGKDDDQSRELVLNKLKKSEPGEKVVAIATRIMNTGANIFVHGVINAAGYKSYTITKQKIGRGLRKAPDKEILDYHDFLFLNNRYLENHSKTRMKWLKNEGHEIKILNNS